MDKHNLTSKQFWEKYWGSNKELENIRIGSNPIFTDLFTKYFPKKNGTSFLEIGGFPGTYSIYFTREYGYSATILDYCIDGQRLKHIYVANEVDGKIEIVNADVREYESEKKYDVVFSGGFIEHFEDYEKIVEKHIDFADKNGIVMITVPNFLGVNGLLQKLVHRENYNVHNLDAMRIENLRQVFKKRDMKMLYAGYYGTFGIWLEGKSNMSTKVRFLMRLVNYVGKRIIFFKSKIFSPYVVIIGKKI